MTPDEQYVQYERYVDIRNGVALLVVFAGLNLSATLVLTAVVIAK